MGINPDGAYTADPCKSVKDVYSVRILIKE